MAENHAVPVRIPPAPFRPKNSLRFLGVLKQPDSDPLELDEGDVVWSSDDHSSPSSSPPILSDVRDRSYSPGNRHRSRSRPFPQEPIGLSALLAAGDDEPMVRRGVPVPAAAPASASGEIGAGGGGIGRVVYGSAPVNVPAWPKGRARAAMNGWGEEWDEYKNREEDDDEEEMVPPHVIVARSHVTRFSVCEGAGRTLKGRDLRRVRNAVFEKTGFLD